MGSKTPTAPPVETPEKKKDAAPAVPIYSVDGIMIYNADCRDVLPHLRKDYFDMILTDPPYFKTVGEWWDNQWNHLDKFLDFIDDVTGEMSRVLSPVGSFYMFAATRWAWEVEGVLRRRFNVLNKITWAKPNHTGRHKAASKESFRSYFPNSETIFFAEPFDADVTAERLAGYHSEREAAQSKVFGDYMRAQFDAAGVTPRDVSKLFPSRNGNITGAVSNWLLGANRPTVMQYQMIKEFVLEKAAENGTADGLFSVEYRDLVDQCEDAVAELAELKQEYEKRRRPFNATRRRPHTDVWSYDPPPSGDRRNHPCEKPVRMLENIILTSTRPGDVVLDCFGGSMRLAEVCRDHGRRFVGIELSERYCNGAINRLSQRELF